MPLNLFKKKTIPPEPLHRNNAPTEPMPNSPQIIRERAHRPASEKANRDWSGNEIEARLPIHSDEPQGVSEQLAEKFQASSVKEFLYAKGGMSSVYLVFRDHKPPLTVKVERLFYMPAAGTEYIDSPWVNMGINKPEATGLENPEKREHLSGMETAKMRREIHLKIAGKLNSVGIQTAKYVGSIILEGEATRSEIPEKSKVPMYAEVWEFVGEHEPYEDEETLAKMYSTPKGRDQLRTIAQGLLSLAEQGFSFDVAGKHPNDPIFYDHTLATRELNLPYPKNFMFNSTEDLVAIDFNAGTDLAALGVWPLPETNQKLIYSNHDGNIYPNELAQRKINEILQQRVQTEQNASSRKLLQLKDADPLFDQKIEEEQYLAYQREMYWARVAKEVDRVFDQVAVACAMLNQIAAFENDPNLLEKLQQETATEEASEVNPEEYNSGTAKTEFFHRDL